MNADAPWTSRYALAAILLVAALLRLQGIGFGLPALYDPDEPLFVLTALKLLREATLNPGWFGHPGSTTIYALAAIDVAVLGIGLLTGRFADMHAVEAAIYADPGIVVLPGRLFILLCGLLVIALTWRLARRLFGDAVAVVAAGLLAIDPIHLRYSQIIRTDMHATVFMLLCTLAAIGIVERGRLRDYLLAALWLGFATATKWPAAIVGVAIVGAALLRMRRYPGERGRQWRNLCAACAAAFAATVIASPFLLIDYPTVMENLQGEARRHHPGATGNGFVLNAWWYIAHPLRSALGTPGVMLAPAGVALGCITCRDFRYVVAPILLTFFVVIAAQALIWERWVVPLLPFLSIAVALAAVVGWRWLNDRLRRSAAVMIAVAAAVVLVAPLILEIRAQARERDTDTRQLASRWARAHIAPGSTVLVEHAALDLSRQPWRFLFPVGTAGCVDALAHLRGHVTYTDVEKVRGQRPIIDLGNVDPATWRTCRADVAIMVNYDRYRREPGLYAREVATYRAVLRGARTAAVFRPQPGRVGGPTVRIMVWPTRRQPSL